MAHIEAMDAQKYVGKTGKNVVRSYPVGLPEDVIETLEELRIEEDVKVRAWIRDLVIKHLPELLRAIEKRTA